MNLVTVLGLLALSLVGHIRIAADNSHSHGDPSGTWSGILFVDSVGHVPRRPAVNTIRVNITLEPRASGPARLTTQIPTPTHVGTARGDFRALNTGLPRSSYPLHAMLGPRDSLTVAINPMSDHGAVRLTGHLSGTTFLGTWLVTDYVQGLSGHFELKRVSNK